MLPFSVSPPVTQVIGAVITNNASWRCSVSGVMVLSVNWLQ
jgi:chitinase